LVVSNECAPDQYKDSCNLVFFSNDLAMIHGDYSELALGTCIGDVQMSLKDQNHMISSTVRFSLMVVIKYQLI
jgi:hypothetical protein